MEVIWIAIVTLLYRFTFVLYLRRFDKVWVHVAAAVFFAALLGPGLLIAHGAVPVPAGLAFAIELERIVAGATQPSLANLVSWPATAIAFTLVSISAATVTTRG